jgi:hypothetical protein
MPIFILTFVIFTFVPRWAGFIRELVDESAEVVEHPIPGGVAGNEGDPGP